MSDMKGSEANPAGYVLIGKAGLSRPLGIKPVRSRSLNISLVPTTALNEEHTQSPVTLLCHLVKNV